MQWQRFDNDTGAHANVGGLVTSATPDADLPADLDTAAYAAARVQAIHPEYRHWTSPVTFYFRRDGDRWTPVGLYR